MKYKLYVNPHWSAKADGALWLSGGGGGCMHFKQVWGHIRTGVVFVPASRFHRSLTFCTLCFRREWRRRTMSTSTWRWQARAAPWCSSRSKGTLLSANWWKLTVNDRWDPTHGQIIGTADKLCKSYRDSSQNNENDLIVYSPLWRWRVTCFSPQNTFWVSGAKQRCSQIQYN